MKRQLIRTLSLTAVLALFLSAMSAVFLLAGARTIDNDSIFDASNATNITDAEADYLSYRLSDESDNVRFRRNLALKWFAAASENSLTGEAQYFSLTIGFINTNFETFTLALETSQFSMSEEEKTTNELTFTNENGTLSVSVNGEAATATVSATDSIVISFSDDSYGNFTVALNNGEPLQNATGEELCFTNIGKYYAQYASSSATLPLTPLTFSATGITGDGADFNIQSLNGQSFAIDEDGNVNDNTPPVVVVNSDIRQIYFGTEIDFDTVTIDVCNTSGLSTDEYYYDGTDAEADEDNSDATLEYGDRVYAALDSDTIFFPETFTGTPQVSIAYRVSDGGDPAVYLIDWSAQVNAEGYIPVLDANDVDETPTTTFITYTKDGSGNITLSAPQKGEDGYDTWYEQNVKPYQDKVTAAAYKDGDVDAGESIQVGSGAYYYIPAFEQYVGDAAETADIIENSTCGYTDMEFTIYYRTDSSSTVQTVTGSYDELRIELTAEGRYQFRIVPTNSAGNAMVGIFASGPESSPVYREGDITSDNVFDAKNLVTFEFRVEYNGPSIEVPEDEGETGYVDVTYTVDEFDIIGISDTYATHYRLYYFRQFDASQNYTAEQLRAADADGSIKDLGEWVMINVYDSDLDEDEGDNAYSWNPDSTLSFIPQLRGFYKVKVYVTSDIFDVQTESRYIEVAAEADVIPGETYWLENNILSVVFLGIGILCLAGIVVILLIKPKNKAAANAESERKAELKEKREKRK